MARERTSFGKYHVVVRLGRGGMGHVYLAVSFGPAGVQKLVVIKQLREDLAAAADARSMFLDEARLSTRLSHPNVVQTNEVVEEDEGLYLTMEFLDGQPLGHLLDDKRRDRFSLPMRLYILCEALAGLHYAHELTDYDGTPLDVVHRDVSPHNIIVTYDGHVKLVDFGVAKAAGATTVTESGVFKGKVRYAAPEQVLCTPTDRRADIFAMGTVLWEVLAGRRLWKDLADAQVIVELASGRVPSPRSVNPDVSPELDAICMKALAVNQQNRYATANELREALLPYVRDAGVDSAKLGAAVTEAFAKERAQMRSIIDAQIRTVREASSGMLRVRDVPVLGGDGVTASEGSGGGRSGVAVDSPVPPEAQRGRALWSRAVAVVAACGVVGAIAFFATRPKVEPPPQVASAPRADAPQAPARVHLSLRARPASARFELDGAALAGNPYEGDLPRDDAPHKLVVVAEGYERREIQQPLSRDITMDLTLAELAPTIITPATSASATAPPKATALPGVAPAPPGAPPRPARPQRTIDEDDPYKR